MQKVPEEVIEALREERPISDPRLEALRRFTETLVEKRGWASEQEVRTFLETGFRRSQVLEVVLGVTLKTLSNYTNNLVDTPLDKAFAGAQRVRKAG
jgi:alkylhydroperoxidase family enzyme